MRIPKRILQAPPEHLDENMIRAFKQVGFSCLPTWTNHGCALFVHVDKKTIRDCQSALHSVHLELHEIDACPLLRLDIKVYDRPHDPLHMDCFLNIQDKHGVYAIEALREQNWMVFHWYDAKLKYIRSSEIHWPEEQRKEASKMVETARQIVSRTGGGDFDRAKKRFIAENPLT